MRVITSVAIALTLMVSAALPANGVVPGNNGKVLFTSSKAGLFETTHIYTMNPNGTHITKLTGGKKYQEYARWSPDGTKIAYTQRRGGIPIAAGLDLFVMNSDGTGKTKISSGGMPTWSPDGTKIAVTAYGPSNDEIYVVDASPGSSMTNLTNTASMEESGPDWSPDGTKIAYSRDEVGGTHIYVMDANGSNVTQVTTGTSVYDFGVRWSPDGTKFAFASDRQGGAFDIYVIDANGANLTRLTTSNKDEYAPVWAPDGTRILFTRNVKKSKYIYSMAPDGTGVTKILGSDRPSISSDWESKP